MDVFDEYRPDPPTGMGYADFRAARGRYLARVSTEAQIARLERVFALPHAAKDAEPFDGRGRPHGGRADGGAR